jgi:hypothetical protein
VQTAPFDASAGHSVGAVVNVSTKSGTNQLHGQAEWALRNSFFDAPNIFQNRAGQKKAQSIFNQCHAWVCRTPINLPAVRQSRKNGSLPAAHCSSWQSATRDFSCVC